MREGWWAVAAMAVAVGFVTWMGHAVGEVERERLDDALAACASDGHGVHQFRDARSGLHLMCVDGEGRLYRVPGVVPDDGHQVSPEIFAPSPQKKC